jgi:hypothetical protein
VFQKELYNDAQNVLKHPVYIGAVQSSVQLHGLLVELPLSTRCLVSLVACLILKFLNSITAFV